MRNSHSISSPSAERKNILLLVPTFAIPGGTQKVVCELGKLLSDKYNILECSFNASEEDHVFKNNNKVLSLGVAPPLGLFQRLVGYVLKAYRLNRLKKRHQIDVTISNLWPSDLINVLSMGQGKRVSIGHHPVVGDPQNRLMLKYRLPVGWIYNRFHRVVAVNKSLMTELVSLYKLKQSKSCFIHNFVTLSEDTSGLQVFPTKRTRLVWFGRLTHTKNLGPFFSIFRRLKRGIPDLQLVVIGVGPQRKELHEAALRCGLTVTEGDATSESDVLFLGFVTDPFPYLAQSKLFILTSRAEGFGLVVLEAMSVGLPIVASDCPNGGPHTILQGEGTYQPGRSTAEETPYGYLMPIPELEDSATDSIWEETIVGLLVDEGKRTIKAINSMRRVTDFSRDRIKQQWFTLLDTL